MDELRKELSEGYPNTFPYNAQGDPESVFFLFNQVLREIIGENMGLFDSLRNEIGSGEIQTDVITEIESSMEESKDAQEMKDFKVSIFGI